MPRRILIVEDEMLIALLIEEMVRELGFEVVGPATRLKTAVAMAEREAFDLAILDINLANERSFPVADILRERGIPFIFASGYGSRGLTHAYRDTETLQKPFEARQLEQAIGGALAAG